MWQYLFNIIYCKNVSIGITAILGHCKCMGTNWHCCSHSFEIQTLTES